MVPSFPVAHMSRALEQYRSASQDRKSRIENSPPIPRCTPYQSSPSSTRLKPRLPSLADRTTADIT